MLRDAARDPGVTAKKSAIDTTAARRGRKNLLVDGAADPTPRR
jgi:hypothetical protein